MRKFEQAKVGDRVWDILLGEWGTIIDIEPLEPLPLAVEFGNGEYIHDYTFEGKCSSLTKYPTLYWNEVHLPTIEEDKKPFNLLDFLKSNLEVKEFKYDTISHFFLYDIEEEGGVWCVDCMRYRQLPNTTYFKEIPSHVIQELNDRGVTFEELEEALNKLK